MANKITGRVLMLTPTESIKTKSGKEYQNRKVVIERTVFDRNTGQPVTDTNDTPIFRIGGFLLQNIADLQVGDSVTITYDIEGRSYIKDGITNYFTDVKVFDIRVLKNAVLAGSEVGNDITDTPTEQTASNAFISNDSAPQEEYTKDDLPF